MVERLLVAFLARARGSKRGTMLIVVGVIILLCFLVFGLSSVVGNAIFMITGARPLINFLETGPGVLVGFAVAVLIILLGVAFLTNAAPQPASSVTVDPDTGTSQVERDRELEQLRQRLREAEQERGKLKTELEAERNRTAQQEQSTEHMPPTGMVFWNNENSRISGVSMMGEVERTIDARGNIGSTIENIVHDRRTIRSYAEEASRDAARRFYSARLTDEELAQYSRQLSDEIYEFLERASEKMRILALRSHGTSSLPEEERRRNWDQETEAISRHMAETLNRYKRLFHGRVLALLYAATERGACTTEEFQRWEREPINTFDMAETAARLAAIGHRP